MSAADSGAPKVLLATEDGIATLTLNRPEVRNAVDDRLRGELEAALDKLADDDAVRAVVVTGSGSAFCAGGDIAGMQQRLKAPTGQVAFGGWQRQVKLHRIVGKLHRLPKPVIAAVNGPAAGLGCDMACACDFIIASDAAMFTMSFILRGLVPDFGGMYFLPRRVGLSRAKELVFTGRRVEAQEALKIGLADRVTSAASLLKDARAWAKELSQGSATALALSKSILDQSFELTDEQALALGREAQAICYTTAEHHEAVSAFLNKSKPR